ncbi:quinone-dependent dihydroorotate dehydrogenase [Aureimonas fodinaquatilis]|uniref:Dihydroorotate dehydrogenase (quinone) n=1 Tax=Aureimonas fodinaquatilis TaxID=2565783 RepID=A0A5B0DWS8_9HYPH|nr:quinone-dependent dihydroorotate dehydrogenase [Aureimonas fodinaquatilis]KAA0970923.1 quinone-dependent dihydroorotate dehydrogenase [Aureimonas fodinaquatilis]
MNIAYRWARPFLFRMDPERAHSLSIRALQTGLVPGAEPPLDNRLKTRLAGICFPNPLGLAAGYDKNAQVPDAMLRLGFGFVEVGTVTPLPQDGNPKPRIFRLPESGAIINRLGFNNEGHAEALARLTRRKHKGGIVGVNIGANKDSANRIDDYVAGVHCFAAIASYMTVNISSPNTPGLRSLQKGDELLELLSAVMAARDGAAALNALKPCPIFLKVAPDLSLDEISAISGALKKYKLDGLIVSNTTLSRRGVEGREHALEAGGLSGRPLITGSSFALAAFRKEMGPDFPLIGAGGVESARTALAKMEAGADLVQLYTSLVYNGPRLPLRILNGMIHYLDRCGAPNLQRIRDTRVDEILERGPPPAE